MKKTWLILLTMLLITLKISAASESQTLWDLTQTRANRVGLKPTLVYLDDLITKNGQPCTENIMSTINSKKITFLGNEDYEVFLDMCISGMKGSYLPRELEWYEKKETWAVGGLIIGILIAK